MSKRRGSAKALVMVFLLLGGAAGLLYVAYRAAGAKAKQEKTAAETHGPDGPMTEEERIAYVKAHVRVEGLELGPDTEPDSDKVVPGLYRVTGTVVNEGDRKIDKVILAVYPKNEAGRVLGSYVENIADGGLAPGASGSFRFVVPEKKEYGGTFDYKVR